MVQYILYILRLTYLSRPIFSSLVRRDLSTTALPAMIEYATLNIITLWSFSPLPNVHRNFSTPVYYTAPASTSFTHGPSISSQPRLASRISPNALHNPSSLPIFTTCHIRISNFDFRSSTNIVQSASHHIGYRATTRPSRLGRDMGENAGIKNCISTATETRLYHRSFSHTRRHRPSTRVEGQ